MNGAIFCRSLFASRSAVSLPIVAPLREPLRRTFESVVGWFDCPRGPRGIRSARMDADVQGTKLRERIDPVIPFVTVQEFVFPKATKCWVAKPIYEPKSYLYRRELLSDIIALREKKATKLNTYKVEPLPAPIASRITPVKVKKRAT